MFKTIQFIALLLLASAALAAPPTGGAPPEEPRPASILTLVYSDPANDAHVEVTGTISGGAFIDIYAYGDGPDGISKSGPCHDPVGAVERVTGAEWERDPSEEDPGAYSLCFGDGLQLVSWDDGEWGFVWGAAGEWDVGNAATDEERRAAASLALLRAIDAGSVTLPDGAPGMGALSAAEWAALGVPPSKWEIGLSSSWLLTRRSRRTTPKTTMPFTSPLGRLVWSYISTTLVAAARSIPGIR